MAAATSLRSKHYKLKNGTIFSVRNFFECKAEHVDGKLMLKFYNQNQKLISSLNFYDIVHPVEDPKKKVTNSSRRPLSEEAKQKVLELRSQGWTYDDIAEHLKIGATTAYGICAKAGLVDKKSTTRKK